MIVLHGLLGSTRNWSSVAQTLTTTEDFGLDVVCMEWRNHGQSLHVPDHSIDALSQDLVDVCCLRDCTGGESVPTASVWGSPGVNEWIAPTQATRSPSNGALCSTNGGEGGERPLYLMAHSMGGVSAMHALCSQDSLWGRIAGAVIVDIGPCERPKYTQRLQDAVRALTTIPLSTLSTRKEAELWLLANGPEHVFRPHNNSPTPESIWLARYLVSDIITAPDSTTLKWRINIQSIVDGLDKLSWKLPPPTTRCPVPTLFLFGEKSPYFTESKALESIPKYFSNTEVQVIPDAGHFVFLDKRKEFCATIATHFKKTMV